MAEASAKRNRNLPQQLTRDHVSPATRLLEKRRQMFEVQEALDAQKEEFQRREAKQIFFREKAGENSKRPSPSMFPFVAEDQT